MRVVLLLLVVVVVLLLLLPRENKVKPNCQLSYQLELVGVFNWTWVGLGFDNIKLVKMTVKGHNSAPELCLKVKVEESKGALLFLQLADLE